MDDYEDPIEPVEIRHEVDRIIFDGKLEQEYNYWTYRFRKYGAFVMAQCYSDDIGNVMVFGPFADEASEKEVEAPELYSEVLTFLKRRFLTIECPGEKEFTTIWTRPSDSLYHKPDE